MILLLGPQTESNLEALIVAAQWARIPWIHIDTKKLVDFSVVLDGSGFAKTIRIGDVTVECEEITGVWTRGLGIEPVPKLASADNLIEAEWRTVLRALPAWIPHARWLNPLDAMANSNRIVQMREAGRLGLAVPPSLITTDSTAAKELLEREGSLIIKRLSQGRPSENADRILFAKLLTAADAELLDDLGPCPVLLQSVRHKLAELRTIVVGESVFSAGFSSARHAETSVDTRMWVSTDDSYFGFQLDAETAAKAVELTQALGLSYGALDFLIDADGSVTFLELNTAGQWGWIEAATGFPISATIIEELRRPTKS
jgi:hypothetical protein